MSTGYIYASKLLEKAFLSSLENENTNKYKEKTNNNKNKQTLQQVVCFGYSPDKSRTHILERKVPIIFCHVSISGFSVNTLIKIPSTNDAIFMYFCFQKGGGYFKICMSALLPVSVHRTGWLQESKIRK